MTSVADESALGMITVTGAERLEGDPGIESGAGALPPMTIRVIIGCTVFCATRITLLKRMFGLKSGMNEKSDVSLRGVYEGVGENPRVCTGVGLYDEGVICCWKGGIVGDTPGTGPGASEKTLLRDGERLGDTFSPDPWAIPPPEGLGSAAPAVGDMALALLGGVTLLSEGALSADAAGPLESKAGAMSDPCGEVPCCAGEACAPPTESRSLSVLLILSVEGIAETRGAIVRSLPEPLNVLDTSSSLKVCAVPFSSMYVVPLHLQGDTQYPWIVMFFGSSR